MFTLTFRLHDTKSNRFQGPELTAYQYKKEYPVFSMDEIVDAAGCEKVYSRFFL